MSKKFAYIDVENMRNSVVEMGYKDLNYEKMYPWLTNIKGCERVYLYVGIENGDSKKAKRFAHLESLGYIVYPKNVMIFRQDPIEVKIKCPNINCEHEFIKSVSRPRKSKANCDVELTLDLLRCTIRHKCSEVIIFSGDGDFAKVYEYVSKSLTPPIKVSVYSPLNYPASLRTSKKLKDLSKNGLINLFALETLIQHYVDSI